MIVVETNLLVYAHRRDSPWHAKASQVIRELSEARNPWAIPWHCLYEFLTIVTHPRICGPPTALPVAIETVEEWMKSENLVLLTETAGYWGSLKKNLESWKVAGPQIHDARIAAVCIYHQADELWSADRDFNRFSGLKVRNPLV